MRNSVLVPALVPLFAGLLLAMSASALSQERASAPKEPFASLLPGSGIADPYPFLDLDRNPAAISQVAGYQGILIAGSQLQGASVAATFLDAIHLAFGLDRLSPHLLPVGWRTSLSLGITPLKTLSLAFLWQHTFGDGPFGGKNPISAGLLFRPSRWFSLGFTASNMSEEEYDDVEDPFDVRSEAGLVHFGAGFAVRPGTERVTFGADLVTDRGGNFWDPSANLTVEPIDGFEIKANAHFAKVDGAWEWAAGGSLVLSTALGDVIAGYLTGGGKRHDYFAAVRLSSVPEKTRLVRTCRVVSLAMPSVAVEERPSPILGKPGPTFLETRLMLAELADDPLVDGVIFSIQALGMGWARAQELAESVKLLRKKGKKVIAYVTSGDNRAYYVAAHADHIVANPAAVIHLTGIFNLQYYLADLLKWAGIEVQAVRIGKYKSYPEMFTRNEPSPEQIEAKTATMEEFYRQLVDGIAAARKVAPAKVESWIDGGPHTAVKAKEAGLVDHVAPLTDVTEILEHFGLENAQLTRSYPVFPARDDRWGRKPRLAVLVIQGTIVDGKSWAIPLLGYRFVGGDDLRLALREIEGDPKIRGLLVRIDSPGGSALASELIYEALRGVARNKPVVVSIGDTAASGGYYSAVASDRIFAMPGSVTGSIGIWSAKVVISDLLDKFKVHRYHMQKGKNAGLLSYDTRASEEDLAAAMDRLADLYDLFLSRVAEGRKKEKAEVDKVAQGRVWSGQRAMEHKLLDVFGGCYEALLDLKSRAGIRGHDAIDLEYYPKKTLSRRLIGSLVGTLAVGGAEGQTVSAMEDLLGSLAGLASTLTWAMEPWQ